MPSLLVIVLSTSADVCAFIADVEGYAGQFFAVATSTGLLWLRYKKPDLYRPFKAWIPGVWLVTALCIGLITAPLIPPRNGTADVGFFHATHALVGLGVWAIPMPRLKISTNLDSFTFGFVYWYIWAVALPRWGGYRVENETGVLEDGTSITKLVRKEWWCYCNQQSLISNHCHLYYAFRAWPRLKHVICHPTSRSWQTRDQLTGFVELGRPCQWRSCHSLLQLPHLIVKWLSHAEWVPWCISA